MKKEELSSLIDHTLLAPEASSEQVVSLCSEAKKYSFASVCVNPIYVPTAAKELAASSVKVCTVIGFPLGATPTENKVSEAAKAIKDGATEIDMVIPVGLAKEGKFSDVEKDIAAVVKCARANEKNIIVKVILETCFLTDNEIVECCKASLNAGADFVKTSTGFANPKDKDGKLLPNGATVHHVSLMRKTVGNKCGVKASGGIRSADAALEMLKAGASRIGTSSSVKIVSDWDESVQI